jgi:hypothetical protein
MLIVAGGITGFFVLKNVEDNMENIALTDAYKMQGKVFSLSGETSGYVPYNVEDRNILYVYLVCYEKTTGNNLTLEQVQEYLSQEHEEDGSVRIFTNGQYPEIAEYVMWANSKFVDVRAYCTQLMELHATWKEENEDFGWFGNLDLTSVDELIKKEADPDYEMQPLQYESVELSDAT